MKSKSLLQASLMASALIGGALQGNAQVNFSVDPGQPWYGYINIWDQANNYQFGWVETAISTASASWAAGPAQPLTMGPNTRLYDENAGDPFWVNQGTFQAVFVSEFDYYQERINDAQIGQTATFDFSTVANSLPPGYEAVGFIKVLDAFATWATTQMTTAPLVAGQGSSISLVVADPGAGTASVQAGFYVKGPYVPSGDPVALTSVQIIPEPTTFALAGLGAAALLIFRRRQ